MIKKMLLLLVLIVNTSYAQLKLPSFFSDNMVLQQNDSVAIWGIDNPKTIIEIETTWGEIESTITNKKGKWKLKIKTPLADKQEHTIVVNGSQKIIFKNVLLGEVWFASGQSNMEMPIKGFYNQPVINSNEVILNSSNNNIRMFSAKNSYSDNLQNDISGVWNVAEPNTVADFSATAYFYARRLEKTLNVPIGIILSAWGGSIIEAWMDNESLSQFKDFSFALSDDKPNHKKHLLFNAMVNPFIGLTIKGFLWYQGESNWGKPKEYNELFPAMINLWREKWEMGDLPFYFVQTSPCFRKNLNTSFLREAQLNTMQQVTNTGMAVILDVGECYQIHPAQKQTVGERLAYWALAKDYGLKIGYTGGTFKEMRIEDNGVVALDFENCKTGLTTFGKPVVGFKIAGSDKVFHEAKAHIKWGTSTVIVTSDKVKKPVAVRYAFENCPEYSLFSIEGLPVSSFRTDHWEE